MYGQQRGFTLVEVMVAVGLLSTFALALTSTLVAAQRGRAASEQWMQAVQLAAEGIEQLHAGHGLGAVRIGGSFERTGTVAPWTGHPGLYRLEVMVSWSDGAAHTVRLVTLARR